MRRSARIRGHEMPAPLAFRPDGIDLHGQARTLIVGIVAGIALTVLYQNATGLNAGQALPAEVAIAPGQAPAQAAIPAQYQQIIDTSPGLPVLPAPHAVALSIEDTKAAVQEKKVDDANAGGVHVVIRKRQVPQTVAPAIEANPAEKPAQVASSAGRTSAGPAKIHAGFAHHPTAARWFAGAHRKSGALHRGWRQALNPLAPIPHSDLIRRHRVGAWMNSSNRRQRWPTTTRPISWRRYTAPSPVSCQASLPGRSRKP